MMSAQGTLVIQFLTSPSLWQDLYFCPLRITRGGGRCCLNLLLSSFTQPLLANFRPFHKKKEVSVNK